MESHDAESSDSNRAPRWEVYEIVAELIEQRADAPPSRNRHFEAWQDKTLSSPTWRNQQLEEGSRDS